MKIIGTNLKLSYMAIKRSQIEDQEKKNLPSKGWSYAELFWH